MVASLLASVTASAKIVQVVRHISTPVPCHDSTELVEDLGHAFKELCSAIRSSAVNDVNEHPTHSHRQTAPSMHGMSLSADPEWLVTSPLSCPESVRRSQR